MKKTVELTFDLDTREVSGESAGYEGTACDLDVLPLLKEIGEDVKRKRKDNKQARAQRERLTK